MRKVSQVGQGGHSGMVSQVGQGGHSGMCVTISVNGTHSTLTLSDIYYYIVSILYIYIYFLEVTKQLTCMRSHAVLVPSLYYYI